MADFLTAAWPYAAAVLVILGIAALVFLVIILFRVSKTMKSVQNMAEQAEKEVTPALAKVNPMVDKAELLVDTVNLEMLRVDSILEDVEQVSNIAGKTASTVDTVTSAPAEAVTSLVDRIRGTIGGKRADKLKSDRVVYPIGSGKDSGETEEELVENVESNIDDIEKAAEKEAKAATEDKASADKPAAEDKPAADGAVKQDADAKPNIEATQPIIINSAE